MASSKFPSSNDIPLDLPSWTNVAFEHQVEFHRIGNFVSSIWVDDLMFLDDLSKFRSGVVVNLFPPFVINLLFPNLMFLEAQTTYLSKQILNLCNL